MKSDFLSSVVRVALLAVVIIGLTGCDRSPAGAIERVLNRCAEVSKNVTSAHLDPAATAGFVADSFLKIDASDCPTDFRMAFQEHINAWRQAQFAFRNNNFGNNFAEGFLGGLTGDPSQIGNAQAGAGTARQAVNDTYNLLTEIAVRYGARIPRSVTE